MKSLFLSLLLVVYLLTAQVLATEVKDVAVVHIGVGDTGLYGIDNAISYLLDDGRFSSVDSIGVHLPEEVPTAEQLSTYFSIMVVTDNGLEPDHLTGGGLGTQLGNVLDDYVLGGGRVVFTAFCGDVHIGIDGEILDLAPYINQLVNYTGDYLNMATAQLTHPVFDGVSSFQSTYASAIDLSPQGIRLGQYLNGGECVLTTADDSIMFINGFPGYYSDYYNGSDFGLLFANALAIPEPTTVLLLGFGGLAIIARRKKDHN